MARHSDYTPELAANICELMLDGLTPRDIDEIPDMPSARSIYRWLSQHEEFRQQYARVKEAVAERMADEIVEIADDARNDWMKRKLANGEVIDVPDNEVVNRARLRVDTRKWLMGKLKPKVYGDKGGDINLTISLDSLVASSLSLEAPTIEHVALPQNPPDSGKK